MLRFLVMFFSIYGSMHAYFFWKVQQAFDLGYWSAALAGFLLLMLTAPLTLRFLDRRDIVWPSKILGRIGYSWLAVMFWFTLMALLCDGWNVLVNLLSLAWPAAQLLYLQPQAAFLVICGLIVVGLIWGSLEAHFVRLNRIDLPLAHLPSGFKPLRIAQISDLHLGLQTSWAHLRRVLKLIEHARPDLLVSTGDLVDSDYGNLKPFVPLFLKINPPLGKLAVLGNHEYYCGLAGSLRFHKEAGFRLLRGDAVSVNRQLIVAGVDDPACSGLPNQCFLDEEAALPAALNGQVTLLLKHQPVINSKTRCRFHIQLSGHTHGGQIFPFGIITRQFYRFVSGIHQLAENCFLYVSNGSGTWGPSLRIAAPPEVTLFVVSPAPAATSHAATLRP